MGDDVKRCPITKNPIGTDTVCLDCTDADWKARAEAAEREVEELRGMYDEAVDGRAMAEVRRNTAEKERDELRERRNETIAMCEQLANERDAAVAKLAAVRGMCERGHRHPSTAYRRASDDILATLDAVEFVRVTIGDKVIDTEARCDVGSIVEPCVHDRCKKGDDYLLVKLPKEDDR